jgi:disulfide bond formation protein DsbB
MLPELFALGTLMMGIANIAILLILLFPSNTRAQLKGWFATHGLYVAISIAIAAILCSLTYSEIIGFPPCPLCWYQRLFLFPLPILLLIHAYGKDKFCHAKYLSMIMAVVGGLIATYHYSIQILGADSPVCAAGATSCAAAYGWYFGYITIPMMSLTTFVAILISLWLSKDQQPPQSL